MGPRLAVTIVVMAVVGVGSDGPAMPPRDIIVRGVSEADGVAALASTMACTCLRSIGCG